MIDRYQKDLIRFTGYNEHHMNRVQIIVHDWSTNMIMPSIIQFWPEGKNLSAIKGSGIESRTESCTEANAVQMSINPDIWVHQRERT